MSKQQFAHLRATNKTAIVENDVLPDVKAAQLEDSEIAKALAAFPSRPDAAILNARRAKLQTVITSAHSTE